MEQRYKIGDAKYFSSPNTPGVNGVDGFYYKGTLDNPTELKAIESKQMSATGSVRLNAGNPNTLRPSQMKDDWLEYIATNKLYGSDQLKQRIADAILNAAEGTIQKYVVAIDKTTGEINFLKLGSF